MNFKFLKFLLKGNAPSVPPVVAANTVLQVPTPAWEDLSTAEFIRRYLAPYAKIVDGALVVPHGTYADVAKILEVDPRYVAKVARRSGYGHVRTKSAKS